MQQAPSPPALHPAPRRRAPAVLARPLLASGPAWAIRASGPAPALPWGIPFIGMLSDFLDNAPT
jgi:hypothetical protein